MNVGSLPAPTSPSRQSDGEPRESGTRGGYVPLVVRVAGVNALLLIAAVVVTILVLEPRRISSFAAKEVAVLIAALLLMALVEPAPAAPDRGSAAGADRPRPAGRPRQPRGADARSAADVRGRRARADVQRDARPTRVRTPRGHRPSAGRAGGRAPANRPGAPRPGGPGADGCAAGVIAAAEPGSGEPARRRGRDPRGGSKQPRGCPPDRGRVAARGARRSWADQRAGGARAALSRALGAGRRRADRARRARAQPRHRAGRLSRRPGGADQRGPPLGRKPRRGQPHLARRPAGADRHRSRPRTAARLHPRRRDARNARTGGAGGGYADVTSSPEREGCEVRLDVPLEEQER